MKTSIVAALAAVGLCLLAASTAPAQSVTVDPSTGQTVVQYYTPYTYGSTSYYYYPNTGYAYTYPGGAYVNSGYVGPTVYGPGYTASYPYMYNQLNYGAFSYYPRSTYYYPGYTTYRSWRWQ